MRAPITAPLVAAVLAALNKDKANVDFEQVTCAGLSPAQDTLGAVEEIWYDSAGGKRVQVTIEIGQKDVLTEGFQRSAGVARQPVGDDLILGDHNFSQTWYRPRRSVPPSE